VSQTEIRPTASAALQMEIAAPKRGTVRAVIAGELDISSSHILRVRLLAALRDRHPTVLDIDMANVTFMDCSTVHALVRIHATAERAGCRMRILNPQPIVARMLEVLGLVDAFGTASAFGRTTGARVGDAAINGGARVA
jgi:anti-sigma B factor antagonist